jgi:hypothetical protein
VFAAACASASGHIIACVPVPDEPPPAAASNSAAPQTRAERTGYTETSLYADVTAFLDSLVALGAPVSVGSIGTTTEGRAIPYAIASRPLINTPEEARRLGRPIVYVQGDIHGGEIEGKEALLMLLRDLALDQKPSVLDSIVLISVPLYNADGNERLGPEAENRSEQNGPERVGVRSNAQGLDLNRDYIKAEAPETRGSLAMFNRWDPDVFVDLHATNGSYHGYALTYAPSLTPAAGESGRITRDEWLPELRRRMRDRHGLETFDYGNFSQRYGADVNTDTTKEGWFSYDHRPRFGTNYYGLRGRVSILSEAYSHDPFERRVEATYDFVSEILSLAAERSAQLAALRSAEPLRSLAGGVPIRSRLTTHPFTAPVIAEDLVADPDSVPDEPGVPRGLRRSGRFRTLEIPVYDRFEPVLTRKPPEAYALGAADTAAVRLLRLHGMRVDTLAAPVRVQAEVFRVDSVQRAPRPFQAHYEVQLAGRWRTETRTLPAGSYRVSVDQPLGVVAVYLLEPESDDGLATWSVPADAAGPGRATFARPLAPGTDFPVLRITGSAR